MREGESYRQFFYRFSILGQFLTYLLCIIIKSPPITLFSAPPPSSSQRAAPCFHVCASDQSFCVSTMQRSCYIQRTTHGSALSPSSRSHSVSTTRSPMMSPGPKSRWQWHGWSTLRLSTQNPLLSARWWIISPFWSLPKEASLIKPKIYASLQI